MEARLGEWSAPMSQQLPAIEDISPSGFIEKVSLVTGEVLAGEVAPEELLVRSHRDYHLADIQARRFMSLLMRETGDEDLVLRRMTELRRMARRTSEKVARALGRRDPEKVASVLFGLKEREYFFRFKKPGYSADQIAAHIAALRHEAADRLAGRRRDGHLELRVLLTGGTGFIGKELLWQAARDRDVAEVVVVIRPKIERVPTTGVERLLSPEERGAGLLDQVGIEDGERRSRFRFVAGDIEKPGLGLAEADLFELRRSVTHVVHSAASVAFDDPYERSFEANVLGTRHALDFSHDLQRSPASPFVAHVGIETSYIHGRKIRELAREEEMVFPRNFYNNYYELTKAMATLETERYMLDKGLRLVQLCPAIVIGESRAGNNRGDNKVVNAPVNLFGRLGRALAEAGDGWIERSKAAILGRMACLFPGDPSAEINLIPVDRVVEGIRASLKRPEAIGERIHLATDRRVTAEEMCRILREETGVEVVLADPTVHRNFTRPAFAKILAGLKQERLAEALDKLSTIFGNYSEWGQPIHEVGKDVEVLGLAAERPDSRNAFRMLCRHNRYVLEYGRVRDLAEVSRRERIWSEVVGDLESRTGRPAGALSAEEFHRDLAELLDAAAFRRRR